MSRRTTICLRVPGWLVSGVLLIAALPAWPQKPPASPVRYTEAREYRVRRTIQLPGSVESRTVSLVASEVAGLVVDFPVGEGDTVLKGQPLAQLRTTNRELRRRAARAQLKEAEARLKQAERNLERATELVESKIISRQQYDDRYYEFNAWQGRVDQLTAEIARIEDDIERSTIRAPFAGVVTAERTEVGEWLGAGDPVVEMLSLDELEVRVEVPERYFRNLNSGARATVTFESLPGITLRGRISAIIPRADPQARTFPLKVRIRHRQGRIGVGMLAQVSFPAGTSYRATVVPKDAVITRGPRRFVYLMNGDNTVSLVRIETGTGVGSWIEVRGGVQPGQRVITRGNERLRPGQVVQGQPLEYELP
ncbi:MAG: efflux RND transporter periplasmic adaptor subunit [Terriglobia bacterium]